MTLSRSIKVGGVDSLPTESASGYVARMKCLYNSSVQRAMLTSLLGVSYLSVPATTFADKLFSRDLRSIPSELLYVFDLHHNVTVARDIPPALRDQFRLKLYPQYKEGLTVSISNLIKELDIFGSVKLEHMKSQLSSDALSNIYQEPAINVNEGVVTPSLATDVTVLMYSSWCNTLDMVRSNEIDLAQYSTVPRSLASCKGLLDEIAIGQINPAQTYWTFSAGALTCLGEIGLPDQIDGVINNLVLRDLGLKARELV